VEGSDVNAEALTRCLHLNHLY